MRAADEQDFAAYVAARRTGLVQAVAVLGSPPGHAAALTDRALARARREWADVSAEPDPDVEVWRLLLEERAADRTPWWHDEPAPVAPALDRLEPQRRTCVVLSAVAGLPDHQVAALAGCWPSPGDPATPALEQEARELAGAVPVASRGAAEIAAQRPPRRPPRGPLVLLTVLAVLVALGTWRATGPEAPPPPEEVLGRVQVRQLEHSVPIPWYAAGELVVGFSALRVPGVRRLVAVREAVVYGDGDGRVVRAEASGVRLLLGRSAPGATLVAEPERGWVAWVEDGTGQLVVVDAADGTELGRRDLVPVEGGDDDGRTTAVAGPLSLEGPTVHYVDGAGSHEWRPLGGRAGARDAFAAPAHLLDVEGLTWVVQSSPDTITFDGPFGPAVTRRGVGAQLSFGGGYVLTRSGPGQTSPVRVYDTADGRRRPAGVRPDEVVLDAVFSTTGALTYVVGDGGQVAGADEFRRLSEARGWLLRTCFVGSGSCVDHLRVSSADGEPILAR